MPIKLRKQVKGFLLFDESLTVGFLYELALTTWTEDSLIPDMIYYITWPYASACWTYWRKPYRHHAAASHREGVRNAPDTRFRWGHD